MSRRITRAAFDFGSGATKLTLAEVQVSTDHRSSSSSVAVTTRITRIMYTEEATVLLGGSFAASKDRCIGAPVVKELFDVVTRYKRIIKEKSDPTLPLECVACATAVYREAGNGPAIVKRLLDEFGIPVKIVSQEFEGKLGYLTGKSYVESGPDAVAESQADMVVWDSGGSSFQLSTAIGGKHFVYEGPWGSSKVTHEMQVKIQGKPSSAPTTNPVTPEQSATLVRTVLEDLGSRPVPSWAVERFNGASVVGIGGPSSAFKNASVACGSTTITPRKLSAAIAECCGRSDVELKAKGLVQLEMALPKLSLVLAVMTFFGIREMKFFRTTGSTAGMLLEPSMWPGGDNDSAISRPPKSKL